MSNWREKLKDGLSQWLRLTLLLLACMVALRLLFFLETYFRLGVEPSDFLTVLSGLFFDGLLFCRILALGVLPFLVLHGFFPKTARGIVVGLVMVYAVVAALLAEYYCDLGMPLDHVIMVYTPEEVKGVATSSARVTAEPFLWFFGTVAVAVLLSRLWRKVKTGFVVSVLVTVAAVVAACCIPYKEIVRDESFYKDHNAFCLAVNQPSYSYIKMTDHLCGNKQTLVDNGKVNKDVVEIAQRYQQLHPEFEYIVPDYPFFRKFDDPDVLGGFISKTDDGLPPNFVFIIIESYGQRLTGVDHPSMSFTPFLDSLKQEGLYWRNCLATSERTFGMLPSIFASAPYGKYGFCVPYQPMPNHRSLLRDLEDNGYGTSYYYGGVQPFDRFDEFLKANKVDFIYVPSGQEADSATYQAKNALNCWGLEDRETLRYVAQRKQSQPSPRPNIDIIMTLTTHEPFIFDGVEAYQKEVEAIVQQHPEMPKKERLNIMRNTNVFACFLYMDDCVRELMSFYQTLPEYQNTVFVITGDHRMGPLKFGGPLDRFSVPLLVYSPLIHEPRAMSAAVSHLDITPSLNAYLSANYDYRIDANCHWMGTSFDTVIEYRNTRKQAFMLNNRDVVDYLDGDFMISNNRLYTVKEDFLCERLKDADKLEAMKAELADFNTVSCLAVLNDRLNLVKEAELIWATDSDRQLVLDSLVEYGHVIDNVRLDDNYEDIFIDVAFDLQNMDTTRRLPVLGVEVGDYYMSLKLKSEYAVSLNTGNAEHYHQHLSIPVTSDVKDKKIKIYLYNPHKCWMNYGNIKVQITGVRGS